MVDKRDCSFCGEIIEPGTGMLFIRKDGTRHEFCSSKCRRNLLDLKRIPRTVKWTKAYIKGGGKRTQAAAARATAAAATANPSVSKAKKPKAAAKPAAPAAAEPEAPTPKGGE